MKKQPDRITDKQSPAGDRSKTSPGWWRRIILTLAILILGGAGSGLIYGWYLIQRKLVPLIETEAGEYLHRPLELGKLKSISLTGASFGSSQLPPTPTNPDKVAVERVKINLAPLYFLRKRVLQIDITLVEPKLYIEQDESQTWTPTDFGSDTPSSEGGIKVDVETIQLQGGELTLVARQSETGKLNPPVTTQLDNAIISLVEDGEKIKFDLGGKLVQGGNFTVDGTGINETGVIDLAVTAQQLAATEISNLLALPIELREGKIDGKLNVKLTDAPLPQLQGTVRADNVSLQIPELVQPFSNSEGKLHFQGTQIELDEVATNFGRVRGVANGTLNLAGTGDYAITADIAPVAVERAIETLKLESPPIPIEGKIAGEVKVTGSLEEPVLNLNIATTTPSRIDKVDFQKITANLDLIGTNLLVRRFNSTPRSGGEISGTGSIQLDGAQNLVFDVRAQDVSGKAIARSYNNQLPVDIGLISGQTQLSARAGNLDSISFKDTNANIALGNGTVYLNNLNYAAGTWTTQLRAADVEFGSLPFGKGSAPTIAKGLVDGVLKVAGTADLSNLSQVKATGKANLDTVGGTILIPNLKIADSTWTADANTKDLELRQLFPELPPEFNDNLSGDFYLTGNIPNTPKEPSKINGFGDLTLANGRVEVTDLKIVDDNWQARARGTNLELKQLSSTTPDQFAGLINGSLKLAGTTDNITPDGIKANGNGSLTLPEGVFTASNLAIANGRFQTNVTPENVDLSLFTDPNSDDLELNGQLRGKLQVTGRVDNLSPTAVEATGNVAFSEGIDLLEQPFGAEVRWDGERLDVLQAKGDGLEAQGYIELDESFFGDIPDKLAAVNYFEFDVTQAKWLDLKKLRLTLPSWATNLDYEGRADFSGEISGIPSAMQIDGDLHLRNFRVENIAFDPILTGTVEVFPESGVNLSLASEDSSSPDKIELVLDDTYLPQAFAIAHDELAITGTGEREIVQINAQNIPLNLLKTVAIKSDELTVPENVVAQNISGELSGKFVFNLNTLATSGEDVEIIAPTVGRIRGDRLVGDFQFADGYFALQDVEFQQRESIYKLEGNLVQKPDDIEIDGRVAINDGQIQDVLVALEIFELKDLSNLFGDRNYADADDLYPPSSQPPLFEVGLQNAPVIEQLQLLAAIQAQLAAVRQERQEALLPEIKNLRGTFDGKMNVSGSLGAGIDSRFEFLGKKWRWGNIAAREIIVNGNFDRGIVTLLPISIELEDTSNRQNSPSLSPKILFTGTFGGKTQSGQLRLVEIPVELIEQVFSFPPEIALGGIVNATASISGTPENPKSRGEIRIDNASLNQTSVESTKGSFNYSDSRLDFSASSIIAADAEPIIVTGNIPYQLPFATTEPDSNRLELQVDVKDKGFALLDIFSGGELSWIDGKGEIALDISGIFDPKTNIPRQLVAKGTAVVNNATIAAKSLPDALLTNMNGRIFFDLDDVQVESLSGNFGGGKISAAGTIPLRDQLASDPLTIALDKIAVDLKGLYDGGVKGKLRILGKATEPKIAGDITLFDGTILLADDTNPEEVENQNQFQLDKTNEGIAAVTEYENLKLELGEDIQISQPPIFTFAATGTLNVNGTFDRPSPEGTIVLERGQVNLFTTQLSLSRDYENTARFTSNNVLDPSLDILLVGSALETTDSRIPSDALSSEISDIPASSFGSLETVRISAKVKGLASQITNRIELTSSPPRTQTEIVALLGGGFVNTLGRGDSTLGLANLAGSALFGSLNSQFNEAFPVGELRLFPTQIIDDNRDGGRIDGLAGEIAFDIFDDFSFSVLKILNVDIPAQFGFRYRLDENFVLRGSTNFEDDSRGRIEFEYRFD